VRHKYEHDGSDALAKLRKEITDALVESLTYPTDELANEVDKALKLLKEESDLLAKELIAIPDEQALTQKAGTLQKIARRIVAMIEKDKVRLRKILQLQADALNYGMLRNKDLHTTFESQALLSMSKASSR
jgi:hypothetical protein